MRSTKTLLLAAGISSAILFAAAGAQAATITGLFNTGTDAANVALVGGNGLTDIHYTIVSASNGVTPRPAVTYDNTAYFADDADSRWVSLGADGTPGNSTTVYELSFDLAGFDASTASISGLWGTDNFGSILLNGAATGFTLPAGSVTDNFTSLHAFTISSGFVAGVNTLDFSVTDEGPPTALRVDSLSGTASLAAGVPEPASWAMMLVGFFGMGTVLRRRSAAQAATA